MIGAGNTSPPLTVEYDGPYKHVDVDPDWRKRIHEPLWLLQALAVVITLALIGVLALGVVLVVRDRHQAVQLQAQAEQNEMLIRRVERLIEDIRDRELLSDEEFQARLEDALEELRAQQATEASPSSTPVAIVDELLALTAPEPTAAQPGSSEDRPGPPPPDEPSTPTQPQPRPQDPPAPPEPTPTPTAPPATPPPPPTRTPAPPPPPAVPSLPPLPDTPRICVPGVGCVGG